MTNEIVSNKELAKELRKPIIRKFNKKVYPPFLYYVLGGGLADMQFISKFNKGFRLLICVVHIYGIYMGYSFKK